MWNDGWQFPAKKQIPMKENAKNDAKNKEASKNAEHIVRKFNFPLAC